MLIPPILITCKELLIKFFNLLEDELIGSAIQFREKLKRRSIKDDQAGNRLDKDGYVFSASIFDTIPTLGSHFIQRTRNR